MYDHSRLPSSPNVLTGPCDTQFSRWSLSAPTTKAVIHPVVPTAMFASSSSFCFPQPPPPPRAKPTNAPIYVNIRPTVQASSSTLQLSNSERPRSSIFAESASIAHLNDLRQRYEAKGVVGIVKPMVHQRSFAQLNNEANKFPQMMIGSSHRNSTRSLYPSSSAAAAASTSSVMYRSRRLPSHGHSNGQPPVVPRRYSSISHQKYSSSHRSSRTTSTSSSTAPTNELSSPPSTPDDEHDETMILDVKRLEMFYSSVGTVVKSARSIARLYITTTRQLAGFDDWSCQQRGVPLWIYNTVRIPSLSPIVSTFFSSFAGSESETHSASPITLGSIRQLFRGLVNVSFQSSRTAITQRALHHLLVAGVQSLSHSEIRTGRCLSILLSQLL